MSDSERRFNRVKMNLTERIIFGIMFVLMGILVTLKVLLVLHALKII